jgi:peptidoglycan hydrolase CwlO-like protein
MKVHFDNEKTKKLKQCEQEEKQLKDIEDDMNKQSEGLKTLCHRRDEYKANLNEKDETQRKLTVDNRVNEDELAVIKKKLTGGMEEYEKLKFKYKTLAKEEYVILVWESRKIRS